MAFFGRTPKILLIIFIIGLAVLTVHGHLSEDEPPLPDYYAVLKLTPDASVKDIRRSFRRLALKYHPDKNSEAGAEAIFKELSEAYAVLNDPEKKQEYDEDLKDEMEAAAAETEAGAAAEATAKSAAQAEVPWPAETNQPPESEVKLNKPEATIQLQVKEESASGLNDLADETIHVPDCLDDLDVEALYVPEAVSGLDDLDVEALYVPEAVSGLDDLAAETLYFPDSLDDLDEDTLHEQVTASSLDDLDEDALLRLLSFLASNEFVITKKVTVKPSSREEIFDNAYHRSRRSAPPASDWPLHSPPLWADRSTNSEPRLRWRQEPAWVDRSGRQEPAWADRSGQQETAWADRFGRQESMRAADPWMASSFGEAEWSVCQTSVRWEGSVRVTSTMC